MHLQQAPLSDREEQYPVQGDRMEELLRSFWSFGGDFSEVALGLSEAALRGNLQCQRILGTTS